MRPFAFGRWLVIASAGLAVLTACGGTEPSVPTSIQLSSPTLSFGTLGRTQQLTATVLDQHGKAILNDTVTWSTRGAAIATVSPSGLVTAVGSGTTQVVATSGSATASATVAVVVVPGQVAKQIGDGQTGLVGYPLNVAPAVLVKDSSGNPLPGVSVSFSVATGGGSVTGGAVMTGSDGVATVGSWTVGSSPGTNMLTATVTGSGITGNPVTFTATGVAPAYNIDVRYITPVPTGTRKAAFDSAVAHWQRIIYGDVPDVHLTSSANTCFKGQPSINETIDDIVIYVMLDSIDGPGKILGQAGPCYIRNTSKLPLMGLMHFDTADIATLDANGQLKSVILHEMGHVLGFGTIWSNDQFGLSLLADPTYQAGTDPHFTGSQALATFDRIGGTSYTGGAKVPVENCCTPNGGTNDSHWRESVFGNELMTGFLNAGANPLSVLTIVSMGDEAYTVNYAAAEPYSHPFSLLAAPTPERAVHLENDVLNLPVYVVDATGRVMGVLRR